ncbi:hypothetical protein BLNAU_330 [Blattamonas nauphoetae]|uniref:Calponin-homology (CH) domain-containing protein n=1 Tax=Blattamonas nauphoetae TaxID=2049346 RepID=A0ABQ9YLI0_9EUKA|nr:hypothetical protein BLNAU_330 [Blattamonas nauphoetae]
MSSAEMIFDDSTLNRIINSNSTGEIDEPLIQSVKSGKILLFLQKFYPLENITPLVNDENFFTRKHNVQEFNRVIEHVLGPRARLVDQDNLFSPESQCNFRQSLTYIIQDLDNKQHLNRSLSELPRSYAKAPSPGHSPHLVVDEGRTTDRCTWSERKWPQFRMASVLLLGCLIIYGRQVLKD